MGGRGRGRPPGPTKPFAETFRGKRQREKEANEARRAEKRRKKEEKKELWKQGLCIGPDGNITSLSARH